MKSLRRVKVLAYSIIRKIIISSFPELQIVYEPGKFMIKKSYNVIDLGKNVKIYPPSHINQTKIGDYSYVSQNAYITMAVIGKFCSIGPNFLCGWGIHPINGISTSPMFYSTRKQNGMTLSPVNKVEEQKPIIIGNDVFIGANVTILDGVTIGDGAVIGAGSVVSKDIPPYAIAVGSPIRVIRYRFSDENIKKLLRIKWWEFSEERLCDVEHMFFDVNKFVEKYENKIDEIC